jgi:threonine dehydrogenase-like Zn-dependent dehydrogenase
MRALVISGPGRADVLEVPRPRPGTGEAVVDIERVGVCGTDVEFFTGGMPYLRTGEARYPMRIGHEWSGVVSAVGATQDDQWLGRRVTGDTMLGCGRCARCVQGRHHVCADRFEVGIRGGWPGALAEQALIPISALRELPASIDATCGALVEPGGNAFRALEAAAIQPGERLLVLGPGAIGLLIAMIGVARGAEVHLMGRSQASLGFARHLGFADVWSRDSLPDVPFDAVVDASDSPGLPALAIEIVEPGRRVVLIGLAGEPSLVDSRAVSLKDITLVGILGASAGLAGAIELYAEGAVDPRPIVAASVPLDAAAGVLAGERDDAWGAAPKIHIDPRR